ncbi:farnesol dehydrogenase-like [Bombus affinis]|uniref:farnesol dehydrogenase-like n=1 Tax=Bombus affinis TaxID=309941 RepID=UPI0021B7FC0A|nr:farnesol dehydrogenase-like [Bombus affinis]
MNYWSGKVAVVTGASGGIGLAISKKLVNHGIKVIGLARRMHKLVEAATIIGEHKFFPIECDLTEEGQIRRTFKWIEENFGGFDILVNNAGIFSLSYVMDSQIEEYRNVVNTNLIAPTILAREAMNPGLYLEAMNIPMGMYGPSKYGLRALGIELRHEVAMAKLKIKITTISPGFVQTDMLKPLYKFMNISPGRLLKDTDIAETVVCVLGTPGTVEISDITVLPQGLGSNAVLL